VTTTDPRLALIAELYANHHTQLQRLVARRPGVTSAVVEDACSYAWLQLLAHPDLDLRPPHWGILAWLTQVAVREAWRLTRRGDCTLSPDQLEYVADARDQLAPSTDELAELRARLALVQQLPERPRRFLLRQMLGYSYIEIAALEGVTRTCTNKQLARAKRLLRQIEQRHNNTFVGGENPPARD
jgi:DNA-directed RNA polymerase specialized sigma24 family protein